MKYYLLTPEAYEVYRVTLDAAMGFPCPGAVTSIEPVATAPRDAGGKVLLAISDQWDAPAEAEEINGEQYHLQVNTL
jgi:hypothetical protein